MKTTCLLTILAFAVALTGPAQIARATSNAGIQASAPAMADGEVRKVDKEQGKVTLQHGPIVNLDMPAMTMVFKVADARMLDTVKEGDQVRFAADNVNRTITVITLQVTK